MGRLSPGDKSDKFIFKVVCYENLLYQEKRQEDIKDKYFYIIYKEYYFRCIYIWREKLKKPVGVVFVSLV
jgi:hypothetical protein